MTRSSTKVHNNLVSETAVMGDVEDLKSEFKAFMQSMTIRQQAVEAQMRTIAALFKGNSCETKKESSRAELQSAAQEHPRAVVLRAGLTSGNNVIAAMDDCMPLAELVTLKQHGSLEEYKLQFQSLLARTKDLQPLQQVSLFTAGLVESLRREVEFNQPGNLGVAIALAQAFNRKEGCFIAVQHSQEMSNMATTAAPSPLGRTSSSISRVAPTKGSVKYNIKNLLLKEMTTEQTTNLFSISKELKNPKVEKDSAEEKNSEISLCLTSGNQYFQIMQQQATLAAGCIWLWVVSGRKLNFLVILELGIEPLDSLALRVVGLIVWDPGAAAKT